VIKVGELVFRSSDRAHLGRGRDLFRRELRALGYIEGKNILFEVRSAEGRSERFPALAEDLVRSSVDVLVASSMNEAMAFKSATQTIPIIMMNVGTAPDETGLVESLARPGGNITGVTNSGTELSSKRLELLKEAAPGVVRVAVLYDPANRGNFIQAKESLPAAARVMRMTIQPWEVRGADGFERVFTGLRTERPDAMFLPGGSLMNAHSKRIAAFALRERLPSTYERPEAAESGGLMYYGADHSHLYRRAAYLLDKVVKGTKPADLPVEQPTKFELVINLKTAKQIGLTIAPNVLARADRVIR
jgi:putative ABC transport system substrate-binding protein